LARELHRHLGFDALHRPGADAERLGNLVPTGVARQDEATPDLLASWGMADIAALPMSRANAQSPDPALLAPGSSRSILMPRPAMPHTG